LGGAADTDVEALRVYSRRIGLAFQVRGRRRVQVVGG
jgi:geranylgeranyl pyrophosphate synthase